MSANFKCTVKNSYSFDIDMSDRLVPSKQLILKSSVNLPVTFNPLHFGNAVSVKQSISTLTYVLELLKRDLTSKEFE